MFFEVEKARIIDKCHVVDKGKKIYDSLAPDIQNSYKGQYIVIEVDSGDYQIDPNPAKARVKMQKKYPDSIFYAARIGYEAMFNFY